LKKKQLSKTLLSRQLKRQSNRMTWETAIKKAFKIIFDGFEKRMKQQGNNYIIPITSYDIFKKNMMERL